MYGQGVLKTVCGVRMRRGKIWNLKVRDRVHSFPPLDPILNQMQPSHILATPFFSIHFNFSPHLRPGLMSQPVHPIWFDNPNNVGWREHSMMLPSSSCYFVFRRTNTLLSPLFWNSPICVLSLGLKYESFVLLQLYLKIFAVS